MPYVPLQEGLKAFFGKLASTLRLLRVTTHSQPLQTTPRTRVPCYKSWESIKLNSNFKKKYRGQISRSNKVSFKDQWAHTRYGRTQGHRVSIDNAKLTKEVSSNRLLDCYERLHIYKNRNRLLSYTAFQAFPFT